MGRYFACELEPLSGVFGGGMTDGSPVLGVGAFIAGSTSGGHMTPAAWSDLCKVWLDFSCGVQPLGSGACANASEVPKSEIASDAKHALAMFGMRNSFKLWVDNG
jgi:hypothetical protein